MSGHKAIIIKTIRNIEREKRYLEYLKREYKLLEDERNLKAVSYDGTGSSHNVSDNTGNTATMITDEQAKLMIKIKRKESKIKHYESIEETLTDEEREVLYRVYVKEQPYWKIVNDMGFSIRTAKRRRETGLDKLCIGLFGEND
mgnify:CR=1 FL=1